MTTNKHLNNLPRQFGDYRIIAEIAVGGMGRIFKAFDEQMNRSVAIKSLHHNKFNNKHLRRFYREIKLAAAMNHPHIVKIYTVITVDGLPALVMEYVDGQPILDYIDATNASLDDKLLLCEKIACAVAYAHANKVIHRDLKPANILVRPNGEPVLLDFGLAKSTELDDKSISQSGEVIGTGPYMAPEQARGQKRQVDELTDVYGLGALLYHLLTGIPPFSGDNLLDILGQVIRDSPTLPRKIDPQITWGVEKICLLALEKNKRKRYASASMFAKDIRNYLSKKSIFAVQRWRRRFVGKFIIGFPGAIAIATFLLYLVLSNMLVDTPFEKHYRQAQYFQKAKKFESASREFEQALACLSENKGEKVRRQKQKNELSLTLVTNYHQQAKQLMSHNLEMAMISVDKALARASDLKNEIKLSWQNRLQLILIQIHYSQGQNKKQQSPEESIVYLQRALELLPKIDSAGDQRQWQNRLRISLLEAYNNMADYRKLYHLGKTVELSDNPRIAWLVAKAAYHSGASDALGRLQTLENQKIGEILGENLYYQGMIYRQKKQSTQAKKLFTRAWQLIAKSERNYYFSSSLRLYLCAVLLSDLSCDCSKSQLQQIKNHLGAAEKELAATADYKETWARYALHVIKQNITRQMQSRNSLLARKMVKLMNECIHKYQKSIYYYIRGIAYQYLKEYQAAMDDLTIAAELDPSNLQSVIAKLELLQHCQDVKTIYDHYRQLTRVLISFHNDFPEPLETFFQNWREDYQAEIHAYGIPFSSKNFERFYPKLFSRSQEIRTIAQKILCVMQPHHLVQQRLRQHTFTDKAHRVLVKTLHRRIAQQQHLDTRNKRLWQLAQTPFEATIPSFIFDRFKNETNFLQKIFVDQQESLLLRFLAARVLAHLLDKDSREFLYRQLQSRQMSVRILAARALSDVGVAHFTENFSDGIIPDNVILQALLAGALLPLDNKSTAQLEKLLQEKETMVRVLAASRFRFGIPDRTVNIWEQAIAAGHRDKNPQVRAMAIQTLWHKNNFKKLYFGKQPHRLRKWLPFLQHALEDSDILVKCTALFVLPEINNNFYYIQSGGFPKIIAGIKKDLQISTDPIVRNRCIIALAALGDVDTIDYRLNAERPFVERVSVLIGSCAMKSHGMNQKQTHFLSTIFSWMSQIDPDSRMVGVMLFVVSRFIAKIQFSPRFQRVIIPMKQLLHQRLKLFLQSDSYFVRLCTISAIMNLTECPYDFAQRLEKLVHDDTIPNSVRLFALSAIFCRGNIDKWPQLEKWHSWIIQKSKQKTVEAKKYAMAAAWGYYCNIEEDTSCSLDYAKNFGMFSWNSKWAEYYQTLMLRLAALNVKRRNRYINWLQHCLTIFDNIGKLNSSEKEWYETCIYKLTILYGQQNDQTAALRLLTKWCKTSVLRNPDFVALWGEWVSYRGKNELVWARLSQALTTMPQRESAQLLRIMAKIALKLHPEQAQALFEQQYYMAPNHPLALVALANYYYHHRQYQKARQIFNYATEVVQTGDAFFGLAAMEACLGSPKQVVQKDLFNAWICNYLVSPCQLQQYPELQKIFSDAEIERLMHAWKKKGQWRWSDMQRFNLYN